VSPETNPSQFSAASYNFFRQVKICALALLESSGGANGTRIADTQIDGWDTHNVQGQMSGVHAERLSWLGYAMKSLRIVLSGAANDPRNYPSIWDTTPTTARPEWSSCRAAVSTAASTTATRRPGRRA
jgi:hypothetical protein